MGKWTLKSIQGNFNEKNDNIFFGHNLNVTYQLLYTPQRFSRFVETPTLEWIETIMMNNHHEGERWEHRNNMHKQKPSSPSLVIWLKRYIEAYNDAHNRPHQGKGHSKLLDRFGIVIRQGTLKEGITDDLEKADEVREYLKKNGGILEIKIHDIPSLSKPQQTGSMEKKRERLLTFDCGVEGFAERFRAQQYIKLFEDEDPTTWECAFSLGWPLSLKTTGLNKTLPPPNVSFQENLWLSPGWVM